MRRLIQPAFDQSHVRKMHTTLVEIVDRLLVKSLTNRSVPNLMFCRICRPIRHGHDRDDLNGTFSLEDIENHTEDF